MKHGLSTALGLLGLLAAMTLTTAQAAGADDVAAAFADARHTRIEGGRGVPLHVVEKGEPGRPAVIFIHGYRQTHLSWFAQFNAPLAERCHLIAFDLRGHGDSGAPWRADGYDSSTPWADDLAQVIRATGARRPLLVGWSFGGNVVMDFVRQHPEAELAGLVLVGSTGQLLPRSSAPALLARTVPRVELAQRVAASGRSAQAVYGARVDASLESLFASASLRTSSFIDAPIAARAQTLDNTDLTPRLTWPVTLVEGARDAIVPREARERLRALLPAARVIEFPESGHAPFVDDAERFNAMLDAVQCRPPSAQQPERAFHA